MSGRVLGVDACKYGWVGIVLDRGDVTAHFAPAIVDLVARAEADGGLAVVAIDIPIGLPDAGQRQADRAARQVVGRRWPSVFMTPVRSALEAEDHASAVRVNQRLAGAGVSIQAFSLRTKIFEVDRWARKATHHLVEIHPEVSFARMAGAPLADSKTTWSGAQRRRDLLFAQGIRLVGDLGSAGTLARVDDILDAAAAAWSARRVAQGAAISLPDPAEVYSDGLPCAIWA
ncbi:MAG TPA: DUF429 domain-containing protein [Pilimelia sp.]|nr:DUF429 domain-containing protein [Pilimelia sp.]